MQHNLLNLYQLHLQDPANNQGRTLSKVSVKNYVSDIRRFLQYVQDTHSNYEVKDLSHNLVEGYKNFLISKGTPVKTINRYISSLRRFGTFLEKTAGIQNPVYGIQNIQPKITLADLKNIYTSYLKDQKKSDSTIKNYISDLDQFFIYIFSSFKLDTLPTNADQITQICSHYDAQLRISGKSTETIARHIISLKQFFVFAQAHGYSPINPYFQKDIESQAQIIPSPRIDVPITKTITTPVLKTIETPTTTSRLPIYFMVLSLVAIISAFGYNFVKDVTSPLSSTQRQLISFIKDHELTLSPSGTLKLDQQTLKVIAPLLPKQNTTKGQVAGVATLGGSEITFGGALDEDFNLSLKGDVTADQFISTNTTQAPLVVASQQLVNNLNADMVDGFHADTNAGKGEIPAIDQNGQITFVDQTKLYSDQSISVEAASVNLASTFGSDGSVNINPDGSGKVNILANNQSGQTLLINNAQLTSGSLIQGQVGNNSTNFSFLKFLSGSHLTPVFDVTSKGDIKFQGKFSDKYANNIALSDASNTTLPSGTTSILGAINQAMNSGGDTTLVDGGSYLYPKNRESLRIYDSTGTDYLEIGHNGTDGEVKVAGTTRINFDPSILISGSLNVDGDMVLGNATTDTINIKGQISNSLGSVNINDSVIFPTYTNCTALETDSSGNLTCGTDDSGTDSIFQVVANVISPTHSTVQEFAIGGTSTSSATFHVGLNGDLQAGGAAANVSYSRFGTNTTNHSLSDAYDLLVSGDFETDGVAYFDGNATFASTITLPNSNTITGSTNFVQLSQGLSVGGANTYYFNTTGDINANSLAIGGTSIVTSGRVIQNITQASVDNLRLDGNTLDTTSGGLTLDSASGTTTISDNVVVSGTTTFNSIAYTWPASQTNNYVLSTNGSGTLSWSDPATLTSSNIYWNQSNGTLFPKNSTTDVLFGGQSTTSADFAFINVNSGTPTATIAGTLSLAGNGVISTSNFNALTLGNSETGDINLTPGTGKRVNLQGSSNFIDNSGNLTIGGNLTVNGAGTHSFAGTIDPTNVAAFDLTGTITGNNNNIYGIGQLTAGNLRIVGNTLDTSIGALTLDSVTGTTTIDDNLVVTGTTTFNSIAYTWPASQTNNYILSTNGSGTLSWSDPNALISSSVYWTQANGSVFPKNSTVDAFIGGQSTTSADFAFINVNSGTPTATIAGTLSLAGDGIISTANLTSLRLGNSATGDLLLAPNTSKLIQFFDANSYISSAGTLTLAGNLDINGTSNDIAGTLNLSGNTLTSSGDLSINPAGGDTNITGNLALTNSSSTTTFGGIAYTWPSSQAASYVLSTNGSGTLSWADPAALAGATVFWNQANGSLFPKNSTVDAFIGGQSTTSADFAFINVNSGTPTATIAGTLSLAGDGIISTANLNSLQLGNSSTGNLLLAPNTSKLIQFFNSSSYINNSGSLTLAGDIAVTGGDITGPGSGTLNITEPTIALNGSTAVDFNTPTLDLSTQTVDVTLNSAVDSLNFDSNTLSIDAANNRVGIGTAAPSTKLHIVDGTGELKFQDSSQNNLYVSGVNSSIIIDAIGSSFPAYFIKVSGVTKSQLTTDSTNTMLSSTGALDFGAGAIGGTSDMRITSAGLVGIGTTTPTALLDVEGSASLSGTLAFRGTTDPKIDILNGENFGIRTSVGGDAGLSEKFTVLSGGNVGIGTTTPAGKVDINGNYLRIANSTEGILINQQDTTQWNIGRQGVTTNKLSFNNFSSYIFNSGNVGIGATTPAHLLHLTGAVTGKALATFNETGDQAIFTASAAGVPIFTVNHLGNVEINNQSTSNIAFDLQNNGDFVIKDNGSTFATFTDTGTFTLDSLNLDGTTIGLTTDTDLLSLQDNILTINGDLRLSDTSTLEVGGKTNLTYNAFADAADSPEEAAISQDNDLFIGGDLEVDGQIYGTVVGTINPAFTTGSVVFQGASGLAQDNSNFFWDDTNNRLGLGTNSPVTKLHLTGTTVGKALAIFDETGTDQNILTASASGTTVLNLDRSGNLSLEGTISDLSDATLSINDNLSIIGTTLTIGNGSNGSITTSGTSDLTLNPTDDIYFDDTRTSAIPFSITDSDLSGFPAGDRAVLDAINYLKSTLAGGGGGSGDTLWRLTFPVIHPDNLAYDLGIGGTASSSALFHVEGNTGNASTSGTLSFRQVESNIQSINMQTLQLGGSTTGNIILTPNADADDYLTISTISNVPSILGTGAYLRIGDLASSAILSTPTDDDLYISNRLEVNNAAYFGSTDYLNIEGDGDLLFVDANNGATITGPDGGTLSLVGASSQAVDITSNNSSTYTVNGGVLTLDVSGDIILDADGSDVLFRDGVSNFLTLTHAGSNSVYFNSGADGANFTFRDDTANNNLFSIKDQGAYAFVNLLGKSTNGDPATCAAGDLYFNSADATIKICSATDTWEALDTGGGGGGSTDSKWRLLTGTISPYNDTLDVLIGADSTASAEFAFTGMSSGSPMATFSGNLTLNAASPTIFTTNSRDLILDASGSKVVVQDDLKVNGGDILGSSNETRITLSDAIDTTLITGKLAVNVVTPVENVDIDGDIKLINSTTKRGDIYTHGNATDRLWTLSGDFNFPGASMSSGMQSPANNDELKLGTVDDLLSQTWTTTADFNTSGTSFATGLLDPAANDQLRLDNTFTSPAGLAGWIHRKSITVNNGSGGTLTNYQTQLQIDTATLVTQGKMQSDCDDMRFTSSDGTTSIPYWIETGCNTSTTVVWIKPSSLSTGDNTIYLYYDNPYASSAQAGASVFDFFDDFTSNGVDPAKWTITNGTGFSVSGGSLVGTNTTGRLKSITTFSNGYTQEAKYTATTLPTNGLMVAGFFGSTSNGIGILDFTQANPDYVRNDTGWTSIGNITSTGTTYVASVSATSTTNVNINIWNYSTHAYVYSPTNWTNGVSSESVTIGERYDDTATGETYNTSWDWIRVRKYSATEPTATINSEEEGAYDSGDQTWTSNKVDAGSGNTYKPTKLTFTWTNDSTASSTTIPKIRIEGSNDSGFSTFTTYPAGVGTYWQDGGTYDINSGVETDVSSYVTSEYRYWRVVTTLNTGTFRLDSPVINDITLTGQGQYLSGSQFWVSETIDAGSGETYTPNRFTATWANDGTDNIKPQFQLWGSNSTTFESDATVYPNGHTTYYQDGGTYDIDSGVAKDVSSQVTTGYRYWKVKAIITTGTNNADTPKIYDIRLQEERPLSLQPYGQKVGIGTTSPNALLDIVQSVKTDILRVASNSGNITYFTIKANGDSDFGGIVKNDINVNLYGDLIQQGDTKLDTNYSNITDTYLYDTTMDTDAGAWRKSPITKTLSWYTESKDDGAWDTCNISSDDRCGESTFPAKALLMVTDAYLYIIDAKTNTMWMKFSQGSSRALGPSSGNTPTAVTAMDGVIYVSTNGNSGSTGIYAFDFKTDTMSFINTTQKADSTNNISQRNETTTYTTNTNTAFALTNSQVNDLDITKYEKRRVLAAATDSGINTIDLDYSTTYEYLYEAGRDGGTITSDGTDGANAATNAFDYDDSTYIRSDTTDNTLIVTYQFSAAKNIRRYGVVADDVDTNEAPSAWTFEGSNDGSTWTVLDTKSGQTYVDIGTSLDHKIIDVDNSSSYTYYRIYVTDAVNSSADNIRIAEFYLLTRRPKPATIVFHNQMQSLRPYISGSSADSDTLGVDNLSDKRRDVYWRSAYGRGRSTVLQSVFPSPVIGKQYSVTAYATASRVPTAWTFEGSNDGYTFTTLDIKTGISLSAYVRATYQISNTNSYKFYRLNITNTASDADYAELAEFEVNGPAITASGSYDNLSTDETNLYFSDYQTTGYYWLSAAGEQNSAKIVYDFNTNRVSAYSYSIRGYVTLARAIKSWVVEGCDTTGIQDCSSSGLDWVALDTRTNLSIPFSSAWDRKTYTIANHSAYRYFRLRVTANNGDATYADLKEFQITTNRVVASTELDNSTAYAEHVLSDNIASGANYWHSSVGEIAGAWIQADFTSSFAPVVTSMALYGTPVTGYSPRDWKLQGSYDQETWTTLITRKNVGMVSTTETQVYTFPNETAYRHYRLTIDRNNGNASYTSLIEWMLGYSKYNNVRFVGQEIAGTNVTIGNVDVFSSPYYHKKADRPAVLTTDNLAFTACVSVCATISNLPQNDGNGDGYMPSLGASVTSTKYAFETDQSKIYYGSANGLDVFNINQLWTIVSSNYPGYFLNKTEQYKTTRNIVNPLNLDHFWPLDGTTSARTYDDYGIALGNSTSTYENSSFSAPIASPSGKVGSALRFQRNSLDAVLVDPSLNDNLSYKGDGYYSYGMWFNSTNLVTGTNYRMLMGNVYSYVCGGGGTCYDGWYVSLYDDYLVQGNCPATEGGGCPAYQMAPVKIATDTWYHLVARRDQAGYAVFINGNKIFSTTTAANYTVTGGSYLTIGTGGITFASTSYNFDGMIDEAFLTYRGLSDEEIRSLYLYGNGDSEISSSTTNLFTSTTLGLSSANWQINQYKGNVVEIASGTGAGQSRLVVKNSATTLTTTPSWSTAPDTTSVFTVTPYSLPGSTNTVKAIRSDQNNLFIGLNDGSDAGGVVRIDRKSGKVIDYYHGGAGKQDDRGVAWSTSTGYDDIVGIESTQDNLFIAADNNLWHEKVGDSLLEAVDKLQQGYANGIFNSQTQEAGGNDNRNKAPTVMRKGWGFIYDQDTLKQVRYGIVYDETPIVLVTQAGIVVGSYGIPYSLDQCYSYSWVDVQIFASRITPGHFYVNEIANANYYYCFTWMSMGTASQDMPEGSFDSGADLAEWYGTDDESLAAGEVVSVAKSGDIKVVRNEGAYNPSAIGIIATQPSIVLGPKSGLTPGYSTDPQLTKSSKTAVQVALAGRVPVKVSLENGPIKAGDYLTTSSIPGYAAKAIQAGPTIGKAMEDFDGTSTITGYGYENAQVDPIVREKLNSLVSGPSDIATQSASQSAVVESEALEGTTKDDQTFKDLKEGKGVIMTFVNNSWYDPAATSQQAYTSQTSKDSGTYAIDNSGRLVALGSYTNLPSPIRIESFDTASSSATPSSQIIINKLADLGSLATGNLKAATVEVFDKLTARNIESNRIATNFISPLASDSALTIDGKLNVVEASVSGDLTADTATINDLTVDNLTVNKINGVDQSLAQISEATQAARSFVDKLLARAKFELEPATSSASPELDVNISDTTNLNLADANLDNLTINQSLDVKGGLIASDLMVQNSLITSNIATDPTASDQSLMIQPTGKGNINLLAGLLILDESGNVTINGDVTVNGKFIADSFESKTATTSALTLAARPMSFGSLLAVLDEKGNVVASIDASGSAQFKDLKTKDIITQNIVIALPATGSASTVQSAANSNAIVGSSQIEAGQNEIEIQNTNVTAGTLIYITPTSDTKNQVLFVKSKSDGKFTVAINDSQSEPITFNFWLVQTQTTPIANEEPNINN